MSSPNPKGCGKKITKMAFDTCWCEHQEPSALKPIIIYGLRWKRGQTTNIKMCWISIVSNMRLDMVNQMKELTSERTEQKKNLVYCKIIVSQSPLHAFNAENVIYLHWKYFPRTIYKQYPNNIQTNTFQCYTLGTYSAEYYENWKHLNWRVSNDMHSLSFELVIYICYIYWT